MLHADTSWTNTTIFTKLGQEQPDSWLFPVDYWNGTIHCRIEVTEKPTDIEVSCQWCFWQADSETCLRKHVHPIIFSKTGVYYTQFPAPGAKDLWVLANLNENSDASYFDGDTKLDQIQYQWRVILNGKQKVLRYKGNNPDEAAKEDLGAEVEPHIPIRFRTRIVVVDKEGEFEPPKGW